MDEMSKTIMDIQEYFDNETQRHVSEEGALAIDRYTGTIDFAVRVYEYGRMHVSDDPASYLNYTKIAMDNLMEFLSVNYPKITNPEYKSEIDTHVQKFLTYIAIELHSFIKKYYDTWQKSYPYVFRNFTKVHEKGPFAFYPIHTSYDWNAKRMDPSIDKNREGFNKYPKLYYDIIIHKNTSGVDLRYFYEVKKFFPGAGMIKDGAPIEECIDLPLVEEDFDLSEYFQTHVSEWKEDYLKKAQSFENSDYYTIPTFARCIPNARVDEVGQDADYDLVVNTSNQTMRYSSVISYIRSGQLAYSEEIPKYILKNRPSFGDATFFQVPYPEILAVDEFVHNIPNTILFISKNDGSTLPDDSIFKNLIDRMKEKSVENKVNTNLVYTNWYDIFIGNHPNKSRLFETPGVPWRFLFHPLENLQKKKIRTVFISLYRLGENRYLIERLEDLVRKGVFVYAYIEPTARGDEKANQKIIKELKEAGVHVKHSCHGLKVHMKAWQIIYDDNSLLSLISTGNFNTKTMGQYIDLHYITTEEKINLELLYLFKILFSGGDFKSGYDWWMDFNNRNLFITPISAKGKLKESMRAAVSDDNDIFLKCNNFTDPSFLDSFIVIPNYSGNGRFMIRTSTVFSPVSKNMEARSKVSKYLEHSRLYMIGDEVFISSADLMKRNMKRRLEILLKLPLGKHTNVYQRFNIFDNMVDIGEGVPIDEYIDKIWDSCNYQLDKLSLKWRIRR